MVELERVGGELSTGQPRECAPRVPLTQETNVVVVVVPLQTSMDKDRDGDGDDVGGEHQEQIKPGESEFGRRLDSLQRQGNLNGPRRGHREGDATLVRDMESLPLARFDSLKGGVGDDRNGSRESDQLGVGGEEPVQNLGSLWLSLVASQN